MKHLTTLGVVGLLTGLLAIPAVVCAQPGPGRGPGQRQQGPTVAVTGEGQSSAAPDMATLRLGATVQAGEATAAQAQVSQIMQKAIEAVKGLGIDQEKIRTADLSLYPVYSTPPQRPMEGGEGEGEPRIVGYRATNTLAVEIEDMAQIGDVIDAAVESGANQLQGIEFGLKNDLDARSEALRRATRIARAKAQVLAEAVGMPLGDLVEVRESGVNVRPPVPMYAGIAMERGGATPVQPGQLTVTANVTLIYRLGDGQGQGGQGRNRPATRPRE